MKPITRLPSRLRAAVVAYACACLIAGLVGRASAQTKGWPRGGASEQEKIQASPLLVDLDGDRRLEIIVPSYDDKLYVYRHDGTSYGANWPKVLGFGDGTIASPAVGDVDGDGAQEIVVAGDNTSAKVAKLLIFSIAGTLEATINLPSNSEASAKATPCLINCQKYLGGVPHPAEEIVFRDGDGQLHIVYWSGSAYVDRFLSTNSLFKTSTDTQLMDRFGAQPITSSVAAHALDANRTLLLSASTNSRIYRWVASSTATTAWDLQATQTITLNSPTNVRFYGSVTLADLNNDGVPDPIIGGMDALVYAFDGRYPNAALAGWPVPTLEGMSCSPSIADLDGDGSPEVLIGANDGGVYAWHADGTLVDGWPQVLEGDVFGSPLAAELDGTAGLEVVAAGLDGHLDLWEDDGTPVAGWPKRLKTPIYATPAIGDLHGGGRLSIVLGGYDGRVYVFDLPMKSVLPGAGWQQFRGGAKRQGK